MRHGFIGAAGNSVSAGMPLSDGRRKNTGMAGSCSATPPTITPTGSATTATA